MAEPLAQDLLKLETEEIVTFDADLGRDVLVVVPVLCVLCDNPRASELLNHSGSAANNFCRMCNIGETLSIPKYL